MFFDILDSEVIMVYRIFVSVGLFCGFFLGKVMVVMVS